MQFLLLRKELKF